MEFTERHIIDEVNIGPARHEPKSWLVEAIGSDGEIYWALFGGANFGGSSPESRAREYAALKFGVSNAAVGTKSP